MELWVVDSVKSFTHNNKYEVGIVLGGYTLHGKDTSIMYTGLSGNRIIAAQQLYRKKKINKIMLSGGYFDINNPTIKEAPIVKKWLMQSGIPGEDIIIEVNSRNTYENAQLTAKFLKSRYPGKQHLLISSKYHLRRAAACFKKTGLNVALFGTKTFQEETTVNVTDFIPSSFIFFMWDVLIHEILSYGYYYFKGYI